MTACGVDNQHSEVGPSGIADIILCPGRVRMQRGCEVKTSFAAAEGTIAHEFCERRLLNNTIYKPGRKRICDGHEITVTAEMLDAVQTYVDHIEDLRTIPGHAVETIEASGSLEWMGLPEVYGTADYSRSYPFQTLYIVDYKHGQGVLVDAEANPQLMTYALIAGQDLFGTHETISMCIVQPRGKYGDTVKVWETTPDVILDWAENTLKPAVKLALSDDAPLNPGEKQCQWCRAKDICPALAEKALQVAQEDFKDFADIKPDEVVDTVPIEKIVQVYDQLPLLKSFIKAVEGRMFAELSAGQNVPGYKLVAGRKSRSWKDEAEAAKMLKAKGVDPFEASVLSPAKAEKALGKAKKEVKGLIQVADGNPVIAPENDKRPAISMAAIDFKDI
jgi:hypothetical protein